MPRFALLLLSALLAACASAPRPEPPRVTPIPQTRAVSPPAVPGLAATFRANQGRLPWPVDGTVVGFFGLRTDPDTGTRTDAVGLDIATAPGEPVHTAFGGRVMRIGTMAAFGTYVMLQHGGFTTVYGNLSRVDVSRADTLGVGAVLGAAGTREERRGSRLFFAVFEGETPVDPLLWLRPRGLADSTAVPSPAASPTDRTWSPGEE